MLIVQKKIKKNKLLIILGLSAALTGCATPPPQNKSDICEIFRENRSWYKASANASDKWGMPIAVPISFMYQESGFRHNARPPMRYFLGFIPYGRASSAYGYSQAKTPTWDDYVKDTGRLFASRSNFADAVDFIGWYIDKTHQVNKVPKDDAYRLYLNYHEGWGGYRRGTHQQKGWLIRTARQVDDRARIYQQQLKGCEKELQRGWLRRLLFG
ncbi:hypothetical protein H1D31_05220 [Alishewanella sp. BS5-314]|uniref:transglycosylase SLT domain-containing protein n=1 Tax=Alishewanella sp. BS5-314 TaxID=2755587 RepID=UPI0021BBAB92|nr:hypothetical protein [Alishewanella sp. BS5-314]MCT8125424.1 hypothetical protein [Alishewanella sp. BS5-314]